MAAPDTQNPQPEAPARTASQENRLPTAERNHDDFAILNYTNVPVVILAAASFLVIIVGVWLESRSLVLGGMAALGVIQLVWMTAAFVTLYRMVRSWLRIRRRSREHRIGT